MDPHGLNLLEIDDIRARLAERCAAPLGRAAALIIEPATTVADVQERQRLTAEADGLSEVGVSVLPGITDLEDAIGLARRGGTLDVAMLGGLLASLRIAGDVCRSVGAQDEIAPLLGDLAQTVARDALDQVADAIDRSLDGHGGVRDDAGIELAQTRRALARARTAATEALRSAAARARDHLQEGFITERAGRPVLAVKASSKSAVPGIVHDRSATGQTLFIEPLDVVEANNHVRELEAAERIEVERILAELSRQAGEAADAIEHALDVVGRIDLAAACAALSRSWRGCQANIAGGASLRAARHPLLDPAQAVPIDLPLQGVSTLVVSGPNAGGKTVALKTLGLLAVIHQCGLRPPAEEAHLPVFDQILVDIGDDQSIERNLSTFSGHVRRLIEILDRAGPRSLVLLDEVAAGTDPGEGAALARAVLEALAARGALTLVTTHHHELKAWASQTAGAANAAVGFDADRLAPTFSIRVGEPGASHALEVAERLGLDAAVLDSARRMLGEERGGVEALLQDAAAARARAEDERDRALSERDEAARVRSQVEQRERELAARVERMREDAAKERERARQQAQAELSALHAELAAFRSEVSAARKAEAQRATTSSGSESERDRRLGAASQAARRAEALLAESGRPVGGAPGEVVVGDRVLVADLGVRGEVIAIDGDTAEVQGPSARLRVAITRLVRDARLTPSQEPAPVEARPAMSAVPYELDVRGQRAEAAVAAVRAHVDAAAMAGLETVRIIHGRGTGALRAAIKEELSRHPLVASSAIAGPDEGGDGATIGSLR